MNSAHFQILRIFDDIPLLYFQVLYIGKKASSYCSQGRIYSILCAILWCFVKC
uniref:Uncharacterized protein n=1 Tax=Anguilla anguilla TaxID=7936 RepID=A0A0E9SSF7_ANGAN